MLFSSDCSAGTGRVIEPPGDARANVPQGADGGCVEVGAALARARDHAGRGRPWTLIRPCPRRSRWTARRPARHRAWRPWPGWAGSRSTGSAGYLESESGCLRCKRRGCFVCIACVVDALPGQCLRRTPGTNPLVTAVFRTERLRRERCSPTCQRRRRPGQARRRQGRLQITAVRRGLVVRESGLLVRT
jgi:hypothetical protein